MADNVFDQFDPDTSPDNVFNKLAGPDPGLTSDLAHGASTGVQQLAPMAGQAGEFAGRAISALGNVTESQTLEDLGASITQKMQGLAQMQVPDQQSPQGEMGGLIRRNAYTIGQGAGQMVAAAGAGAATGAAIGSIVPGIGTLFGAGAGASLALIGALPALFGGSTAEQTYEKVQQAGGSDNQALAAGGITGGIALLGGAVLNKVAAGKMLDPVIDSITNAATDGLVQAALSKSGGQLAKGIVGGAAEGAAVNVAQQDAIQETNSLYGAGEAPGATDLINAGVQGAVLGGAGRAISAPFEAHAVSSTAKLLADPNADPEQRANAVLGTAMLIGTKDKQVASDFGLYAQQQIQQGLPIEIAPDSFYTAFAEQQKLAENPNYTPQGAIAPTGDEAAAAAPNWVTDPNAPAPTAAPAAAPGDLTRTTQGAFPNFVPTGDELAATLPKAPVAPEQILPGSTPIDEGTVPAFATLTPNITDSIGGIFKADNIDDVIAAAEKSVSGPVQETQGNTQTTRAGLVADQKFYADQAAQAQEALRSQSFDTLETQALAGAHLPDDVFQQRMADLAAQEEQARQQGFTQMNRDQLAEKADTATVTPTEAEAPSAPTPLSGAMSAELTRLGNKNPANLTTTQLAALALHHPDEAVRQQALDVAQGRKNAQILADAQAEQEAGSGASLSPNRENLAEPVGAPQTTEPLSPTGETEPASVSAAVARLNGEMASSETPKPGDYQFQSVNPDSLPKQTTAVNNHLGQAAATVSKDDYALMQKSADLFGKKVELFRQTDGPTTLDGAVVHADPNTIYVNADAGTASHLVVFGHELAHQMQTEAPELYKGMRDAIGKAPADFLRYYNPRMSDDDLAKVAKNKTAMSQMTDEFIADLVGNRFGEYKTWQQVFGSIGKENKPLVYRVADFVRQFIQRLLGNDKFKSFATDDMVDDLGAAKTAIRRALADYATQTGSRPMQHEADQLRANATNRQEKTIPTGRADVGKEPSKAAPAPVEPREPEPSQGSQRIEPSGTPRTERVAESGERAAVPEENATSEVEASRTGHPYEGMSEDEFVKRINPEGTRITPDQRPTVYQDDIEGMMPADATRLYRDSMDLSNGERVQFFKADDGGIYAKVNGKEVGFALPRDGGTDLTVAQDYQGKGIGTQLSLLYRRDNPFAPSGGLTAGGEAAARAAFRLAKPVDEGEATANPLSTNPQVRQSGERALYLGKLDSAQEAAARAVGGITTKQTYKQRMDEYRKDLGLRLQQGIADQFAPIKAIDEEAYKQTRLSKGAATGGLEAMMLYGKPMLRDGVLDVDVHDKGMAATLSDLDGEHGRFLLWVAAQRAEQLKTQGKENLFSQSDISALKTLDKSDATHPQRQQKFAQALKEYNAMNDAVLKVAEQSGILDPAARALFKDQPYVPFYRVMDDGEGMKGPAKSGGLVNQYAFKKLKGGTNQLNQDLLANTMQNWAHLLDASAKNRAAQLSMDAAEKLGIADKVTAAEAGKGTIRVKVNGQDQHWEVSDPHLLTAVSAMSAQVPNWMKPLASFKRILTTGTTLSPAFRIRNLIRDTLTVMGTSDIKLNPYTNIRQGLISQGHHSQTHASMLASGGIINFGTMLEGNEAARAHRLIQMGVDKATILNSQSAIDLMWHKAQQAAEMYHEIGNKFENANRGALFEQKLAKGASFSDAAYAARDLMDFSLQGANPVVRFLTTSVPFLNARIQGAYKLGRAAIDNPARAATVMGAVAMGSLALMLHYQDDPDWKQRPDWDRDNYWWFKVGDTAYRIPKPFEVGAVGTLAERTWEEFFNPEMTNSRYVGELRDILMNQFNLNPTPQIVRPFLNVYANRDDFTGNQIETSSMQSLQPEDRYTPYTSLTGRFLGSLGLPDPTQLMMGRYSKLSPVQFDSLINGYFGWLGTTTTGAVDAALRPFSSVGEKPALQMRDYTMGFAEGLPANASRYVDTMYQNLDAINQAYASYHQALNSGQFEKAREILAGSHTFGPSNRSLIAEHGSAVAIQERMALLNNQQRRVLDSQTLSATDKRNMLNRITQQKDKLAEMAAQTELRYEGK